VEDSQSEQGEGEQGLVDAADHDTHRPGPVLTIAHMRQCSAAIEPQEREAWRPQAEANSIGDQVGERGESDEGIYDG